MYSSEEKRKCMELSSNKQINLVIDTDEDHDYHRII